MKILGLFCLLATTAAHAETPATVDQLVQMLMKNPNATLNANTQTAQKPVNFEVTAGKTTLTADSDPDTFFAAVRAALPVTNIESPGFSFIRDYGRLRVKGSDVPVFDINKDVHDNFADAGDLEPGQQGGNVSMAYKVLSVVGPYVSYSIVGDSYYPGAAHPNYTDTIATADVSVMNGAGDTRSYASANLGELVDEASLVAALKADRFLRSKIASPADRKRLAAVRTLKELGEVTFDALMGSCYGLPVYEGRLESFAIYDYDSAHNRLSVRVPMGASSHACGGAADTKQLGLVVKPDAKLQALLAAQLKAKNGLLMKNAR